MGANHPIARTCLAIALALPLAVVRLGAQDTGAAVAGPAQQQAGHVVFQQQQSWQQRRLDGVKRLAQQPGGQTRACRRPWQDGGCQPVTSEGQAGREGVARHAVAMVPGELHQTVQQRVGLGFRACAHPLPVWCGRTCIRGHAS